MGICWELFVQQSEALYLNLSMTMENPPFTNALPFEHVKFS